MPQTTSEKLKALERRADRLEDIVLILLDYLKRADTSAVLTRTTAAKARLRAHEASMKAERPGNRK